MAQRFLAPAVTFEGIITQNGSVSSDSHVITRGWAKSNVINAIHADSAPYAELVSDGGVQKLKLKPLTITSVTVNTDQTSFANFVSNVYTGSNFQEGDIVFLTNAAISPIESYIHNGGTAGNADDWELVNSGLSDAQIRAKFSASSGINYNAATGAFTADQAEIRGFFSGASGVTYNAGTGQMVVDQSFVRGLLSASGLLSYNSGTGAFSIGNADVRGAIQANSAAGNLLSYNNASGDILVATSSVRGVLSGSGLVSYDNSTGAFSLTSATVRNQISEASGSLTKYDPATGEIELTNEDVRGALSATGLLTYSGGAFGLTSTVVKNQFSATGLLTYSSGAFGLTAASVRQQISAASGALLAYDNSNGQIDLTAASVRGTISAESGSLVSYNNGTGKIDLQESQLRKEFQNQTLTAGAGLTLTHNLGKQLVHVSAMDGSGNAVELQIVYSSTSAVQVTSTVGLSGVDIAVSI